MPADDISLAHPREIARAISQVENETAAGEALIRAIYGRTGQAYLIGVTGPPGAGKSTLVDRLTAVIRAEGKKVGVIAVDPTSPFTGGALLGDRVRMGAHAGDDGVFIRSMATRGALGGLSRATGDVALVLDAAGFEVILIETVGVGQAEVDIVRTADLSIVTLVPGTGDEVQALKAGIMEIADIFVVNKADREGADKLVQAIAASQSLQTFEPGAWKPPILKTVATSHVGVSELWAAITRFRARTAEACAARRRARQAYRLRELLAQRLLEQCLAALPPGEFDRMVDDVAARAIDPYSAMHRLIAGAHQTPVFDPTRL